MNLAILGPRSPKLRTTSDFANVGMRHALAAFPEPAHPRISPSVLRFDPANVTSPHRTGKPIRSGPTNNALSESRRLCYTIGAMKRHRDLLFLIVFLVLASGGAYASSTLGPSLMRTWLDMHAHTFGERRASQGLLIAAAGLPLFDFALLARYDFPTERNQLRIGQGGLPAHQDSPGVMEAPSI